MKERTYFGDDCVNDMLTNLTNDWNDIAVNLNFPINFSDEDQQCHNRKSSCDICQCKFNKTNRKKMQHHFHYLQFDNYAGTLCALCNLQLKTPHFLPVIVHNHSYDLSLILKEYDEEMFKVNVNKKDGMRFYSATIGKLKFVDSCNMLKGSLSTLASQHILDKGRLGIVKSSLSKYSDESVELLCNTGKQFLPYEYIEGLDKLQETSLPSQHAFYSPLTNSHIGITDYQHAQTIWDKTDCKTLQNYIDLYLNLDVALLADIYLLWRSILMDLFKLDCLYSLTLASFAIEAMYYICSVSLDSISDPNLYHIIKKNIRGGFCTAGQRHVIANNKDTNPNFDARHRESNYLLYVDFNSLHPTVMSQFKLSTGDFVELNDEELNEFMKQDLTQVNVEGDTGYYVYCDIKPIRPEIIDKSIDFPLLLYPVNIQQKQISEFSHKLLEDKNMKLPLNNTKIVAHHCGVKNYLIALPLLQFLISQGVEIEKVHKVIKFKQGFFLKNFIDENIRMRAAATNPFIKNALKLINNAIYGRTLLNPLNYVTEVKICHGENNSDMLKSFTNLL